MKFSHRNKVAAILTVDLVFKMYEMRDGGKTIKQVAEYFGVNDQHAGKILRGDSWREAYKAYYGEGGRPIEGAEDIPQAFVDEMDKIMQDALLLQKQKDEGK